ncbi:MAG: right-handed parallel beta-helix repeat-containing protein [Xanthomonadales bacterium]|nr:right-handed parallel beta-helix repeat-containing protein [Xanthomonadales bacterium]
MRGSSVSLVLAGLILAVLILAPCAAEARTYTVGPVGRDYTQLYALFDANNLAPGDIVEVDGSALYASVVVGDDDGGAPGNPVIIRWRRVAGATRPVLQGGLHTIKFQQSNHVVFEGFEVRGGANTCVFSEAHDITVRDAVIHACPGHGILGADLNSGSFTLEYSEIYDAGSGSTRHPIYMQSDEIAHPGSVFRMRYNYVHNGNGGNLLKSRHERSEIHSNWFEGSVYQEIELIGPDCETQASGWTRATRREDAELLNNVIVHTSTTWPNAIRLGGDLNGASDGRVRMVGNTIVFDRPGAATAVYVQLGVGSVEMHNNAIFQTGGAAPAILRENTTADTPFCAPFVTQPWSGARSVSGTRNWVQSAATFTPPEWTGTVTGGAPGFRDVALRDFRPLASSPLRNAGINRPPSPAAFPMPWPLPIVQYDPPLRAKLAIGDHRARIPQGYFTVDIGALEEFAIDSLIGPFELPGSPPKVRRRLPVQTVSPAQPAPIQLRNMRLREH